MRLLLMEIMTGDEMTMILLMCCLFLLMMIMLITCVYVTKTCDDTRDGLSDAT